MLPGRAKLNFSLLANIRLYRVSVLSPGCVGLCLALLRVVTVLIADAPTGGKMISTHVMFLSMSHTAMNNNSLSY